MSKRLLMRAVSTLVLALSASSASASLITTRADLQTLLGGGGTLETFESFNVADGSTVTLDACGLLDASTTCGGQGPGLVVGGVSFDALGFGVLQWDGAGYFGSPSKELSATDLDGLLVNFTTSVNALGIDLRAFTGFPSTALVSVYGTDDTTLLGTFNLGLLSSGTPMFWGFSDAGGIGSVQLTNTDQGWAPIVDNLEFGQAQSAPVPEPASLTLLGVGLMGMGARRWRQHSARRRNISTTGCS